MRQCSLAPHMLLVSLPFIISMEPSIKIKQEASRMADKIKATSTSTSSGRLVASSLELDLAAGGLQLAAALSGILQDKLGLLSMQDIRLLNAPEQLELAESLCDAGRSASGRAASCDDLRPFRKTLTIPSMTAAGWLRRMAIPACWGGRKTAP